MTDQLKMLWNDYLFFRINVIVVAVGVLHLLFR